MGVMDNSMHLGAIPARFETWPLVRCADLSTLLNLLGPRFLHQLNGRDASLSVLPYQVSVSVA